MKDLKFATCPLRLTYIIYKYMVILSCFSYGGCLSSVTGVFLALRVLYNIICDCPSNNVQVFRFCFVFFFVSWFSLLSPFLASSTMSFLRRLYVRPLSSVCFLPGLFCFLRPCSFPVCFAFSDHVLRSRFVLLSPTMFVPGLFLV